MAACAPINPVNGATVTCAGAANPLAPSYAASADTLTVNLIPGSSVGVLLGLGGTAMSLTGNGTTLNNAGTINPSLLGLLSLLSSGAVIGNPYLGASIPGSTVNVDNGGVMEGTVGLLGLNLADLTGLALAVRNGAGGGTSISNSGTVGASALLGVSMLAADAPVIAGYGGSQISFVNTGTITGRSAFETSAFGSDFVNAGTISGSVSLGTNGTNTFHAVSGSNINNGGSLGLNQLGVLGINIVFAPTGEIDGGAGGNNTLVLQNVVAGPGSGTGGPVTSAPAATYVNFQHLTVNSGTWNLQGALVSGDATLNGGLANFDNGAAFGSGVITANGGAIGASTNGLTLSRAITVNAGGLTASGGNDFTLADALNGQGSLTKNGAGTLTLAAANDYAGGTTVDAGAIALGAGGSLPTTGTVNLQNPGSTVDISVAGANQTIGGLAGDAGTTFELGALTLTFGDSVNTTFFGGISGAGGIVKQGSGVSSLGGANTFTGGVMINAGTLALAAGGSVAPVNAVVLTDAAGVFDISAAGANQTIAALSGVAGSQVALGANTLTLGDAAGQTFAGAISGVGGGIVKQGTGTLTLSGTSNYSGATTINAGEILAASSGALGGSAVAVNNGGVLNIAATQMPTAASYTQIAGGVLKINADGASGQNSKLGVQGTAALGGTLYINFASAPTPGQIYPVITAGAVNGTFAGIASSPLPAGFVLVPIYSAGGVQVRIGGPATHFGVSAPANVTAGTAFNFTVTALDQSGNTVTGYAGTVHFVSSDGSAVLPADATLSNGVGTFSATLKTAGSQTLIATDTTTSSITGTSNNINVASGAATHFGVSAPASATAGTAFNFSVTALDQNGNTATAYAGTAHFTSSDGNAVLPADAALSNGVGTFNTTLKTAGSQTLTATDTATASITGSATTTVGKATTTTALTALPTSASYGESVTLTAKVSAPAGNTVTPTGTVDFSDGGVAVPGCSGVVLDASGNAICTTSGLAVGAHDLRADYAGDANTSASYATLQYLVANATTSMTLTASPNPAVLGQTVILTATVSGSAPTGAAVAASFAVRVLPIAAPTAVPAGSVEFFDGPTSLGSVALAGNGVATLALPSPAPGSHAISAVYPGGDGFASASAQLTLAVNTPPVAAPILSTWMLMLLAATLAAIGIRFVREA